MPRPGRESAMVLRAAVGPVESLMMNFQVEVEHLIEIEGVDAGDGHAQRVADEIAHVMILEEGWILGEDGALLRALRHRIREP